jgi:hypothetical protein
MNGAPLSGDEGTLASPFLFPFPDGYFELLKHITFGMAEWLGLSTYHEALDKMDF